jgi:hypothetical protein
MATTNIIDEKGPSIGYFNNIDDEERGGKTASPLPIRTTYETDPKPRVSADPGVL